MGLAHSDPGGQNTTVAWSVMASMTGPGHMTQSEPMRASSGTLVGTFWKEKLS